MGTALCARLGGGPAPPPSRFGGAGRLTPLLRQGPLLPRSWEHGGASGGGGGPPADSAGMENWNAEVVGAPAPPRLADAVFLGVILCGAGFAVLLVLLAAVGLPLALAGWAWSLPGEAKSAPAIIALDVLYVLAYGALGVWIALGRPPWHGLRSNWGRWSFASVAIAGVAPLVMSIAALAAGLQGSGGSQALLVGAACQTVAACGILGFWTCDVMDYRQVWKV